MSFLVLMFILNLLCCIYLVRQMRKFRFVKRISRKSVILSWTVSFVPIIILTVFAVFRFVGAEVLCMHWVVFWAISDFIFFIIKRIRKRDYIRYWSGMTAAVMTFVFMSAGWFLAHHVFETDYTAETKKEVSPYKIAQITDVHIGATFSGDGFAKHIDKIKEENPDILVITGDFTDDDTTYSDLQRCMECLNNFEPKYGKYFVFGNHDKGYYRFGRRNFSEADLRSALEAANIKILEDEAVEINNDCYIIGRKDKSDKSRKSMSELVSGLDTSKYMIVLDHQPNDYAAESEAHVDMVLSGHTHGGHIFPVNYIGLLIGANDKNYGCEIRDNTTFIVSSGISGWAIPFKTCAISEYVIVDIVSMR
ncbi:MAG: metallophosphoesterase [Monoglobaceae bacterium]